MLEKLNQEQESLADSLAEEWIKTANGGQTDIDRKVARQTLTRIYALAGMKAPDVLFMAGPMEAILFCKKNLNVEVKTFDWFGIGYDAGWVSFFDYFQRIGILERDDEEFNTIKEFMRSGVWVTIMFEGLVVCIARPSAVKTDDRENLHCENAPAVVFADGYEEFVWHGVFVDEKIILRPEEITREDIMNEKNSEVSRAMAEKLGWEKYMELAGTKLIDKMFDPATKLHYELYDFDKRFDLTPKLLKMESPELNDGTRPYYIEPVDPGLKTCAAARKWQFRINECPACKLVSPIKMWRHGDVQVSEYVTCEKCNKTCISRWPTVDECNENPELQFEIER